jgi:hypothetical protein
MTTTTNQERDEAMRETANDNNGIVRGSGDVFADLGVDVSRCNVTGNPVGTDTWAADFECSCIPCQVFLHKKATPGQIALKAFRASLSRAIRATNQEHGEG